MEQNRRGVGVFMLAGLALAIVVGVVVWNASAPGRTVTAGYTSSTLPATQTGAELSPASRTTLSPSATSVASESSVHAESTAAATGKRTSASKRPNRAPQAGIGPSQASNFGSGGTELPAAPVSNPNYRMEADPFAPPHAVTSEPSSAAPTVAYRPTNVRPMSQESEASSEFTSAAHTPVPSVTSPAESRPSEPKQTPAPQPAVEKSSPEVTVEDRTTVEPTATSHTPTVVDDGAAASEAPATPTE